MWRIGQIPFAYLSKQWGDCGKVCVNLPPELDIQVHEDAVNAAHLVLSPPGKLD